MATKGCLWLLLAVIVFTSLLLYTILAPAFDAYWCNEELKAGHCEMHFEQYVCYCIDSINAAQSIPLYESAQAKCQTLNGSLATLDDEKTLLWIAKRIYAMGVDEAFVGLNKIEGEWYWLHPDGKQKATNLLWREEFEYGANDTHAVLNVASIKKEIDEAEGYDENYVYYNYDYYIDNDKGFQWYGYTTSSNKPESHHIRGVYHICVYESSSPTMKVSGEVATITSDVENLKDHIEDCSCPLAVEVILSNLDESYTFSSPNYPNNYCSDLSCRWIFTTNSDKLSIKIDWLVFSIESGFDFAKVYGGADTMTSPLVLSCTGSTCPDYRGSGDTLQVHFTSDHVTTRLGFKARAIVVPADVCYCSEMTSIDILNEGDHCTINSANFPDPHCTNQNCKWLITARDNLGVKMFWDTFDLGPNSTVLTYDGHSAENELLQSCSGSACETVISSQEQMLIHFVSGSETSQHKGFNAYAQVVINYCTKLDWKSLGSLSYSSERSDGNIPMRASATVTCPPRTKISKTIGETADSVRCEAIYWNRELYDCVPVCHLKITYVSKEDITNICSLEATTDMNEIEKGHTLIVEQQANMKKELFECIGQNTWAPKSPVCHHVKMVIAIAPFLQPVVLLVATPFGIEIHEMEMTQSVPAIDHFRNQLLSDGRLLVAGGSTIGGATQANAHFYVTSSTLLYDLAEATVEPGPAMQVARHSFAIAFHNHVPYICGGMTTAMHGCCSIK